MTVTRKQINYIFLLFIQLIISGCNFYRAKVLDSTQTLTSYEVSEETREELIESLTPTKIVNVTSSPEVQGTPIYAQKTNTDTSQVFGECLATKPTLTSTERDNHLTSLLEDDECQFPCFLGIRPGDDFEQIFSSFSNMYTNCYISQPYSEVFFDSQRALIEMTLYGMSYSSESQEVFDKQFGLVYLDVYTDFENINIISAKFTDISQEVSYEPTLTKLMSLDLPTILLRYGEPDNVLIDIRFRTGIGYSVILFFEEHSTVMIYHGIATLSEPMQICPIIEGNLNGRINQIRVFTSTKEQYATLLDYLDELTIISETAKPISDSGYTLDEFMDILHPETTSDHCFYFVQSTWKD